MKFSIHKSIYRSSTLKKLLKQQIIPQRKQYINKLRKQVGNKVIADVHVQDAIGGMKGLPVLFHQGSSFDQNCGLKFKGFSIPQFHKNSPKVKNSSSPLPQAMWWLLTTGRLPTDLQILQLQKQWRQKGSLVLDQVRFILSLPDTLHPMTMLSMTILYLQKSSLFFDAYQKGFHKSKYWQLYYDDAMNLLAKLPRIAAIIYRHKYRNSNIINADNTLDWAANFAHMLGSDDLNMRQFMRSYLSIHSDYEGGNISTHTAHLVGSALSDPYLSYSAGVNALAGPLHGLTSQQGYKWLMELRQYHSGRTPNRSIIEQFTHKTIDAGKVIPGYGHRLLKGEDPRLVYLKEFAQKNVKKNQLCQLVNLCFQTVPQVLRKTGKINNPYPNVDVFSGCLLHYFGIKQYQYFTVIFAVSRAMGILSNGIWARAFGLPIQRPNSINISFIQNLKSK